MEVIAEQGSENNEEQTAQDYMGYDPEVFKAIEEKLPEASSEEDINPQELINKTLKEIKVDDKGKFIYPEDTDPVLKAAVAATKSFRDTQSSYTKSQQELKALQAEAEALKEQLAKYETPTAGLSDEEQQELETLKYTDPDAWYHKMKALEQQAVAKVDEKFKEVREQAKAKTAEEQRIEMLEQFNSQAETPLTKEQLELDVPARWISDVQEGKLDFNEFLERAYEFIHGPKIVATPEVPKTTDLNKVSGGEKITNPQGIDYAHITF